MSIHWTITLLNFFLLVASGLKPKNEKIINLMFILTVLRNYLPFIDIDER